MCACLWLLLLFLFFVVCLFVCFLLFVVVLFCSTFLSAGNREGVLYNVSLTTEHSFRKKEKEKKKVF